MSADSSSRSKRGIECDTDDCDFDKIRPSWNGCPMCLEEAPDVDTDEEDNVDILLVIGFILVVLGIGAWKVFQFVSSLLGVLVV